MRITIFEMNKIYKKKHLSERVRNISANCGIDSIFELLTLSQKRLAELAKDNRTLGFGKKSLIEIEELKLHIGEFESKLNRMIEDNKEDLKDFEKTLLEIKKYKEYKN